MFLVLIAHATVSCGGAVGILNIIALGLNFLAHIAGILAIGAWIKSKFSKPCRCVGECSCK